MREIRMPAVGVGMEEGVILRWLAKPGADIEEGAPLAEIETDKTTMELTSPVSGRLGEHLFPEGAVVPVGTTITVVT
jgi:pyruvate dehydrogenase E2 component (dihydrolipoamide acetyltransferase)